MLGECRRKILIYRYQLPIIDIIHLALFKSNDFQYGTRSFLASPTESLSQDSAGAGNCLSGVTWDRDENRSGVLVSLKAWSSTS